MPVIVIVVAAFCLGFLVGLIQPRADIGQPGPSVHGMTAAIMACPGVCRAELRDGPGTFRFTAIVYGGRREVVVEAIEEWRMAGVEAVVEVHPAPWWMKIGRLLSTGRWPRSSDPASR